eukprot:1755399-Ditylum_brightwellii.AAC.1
MSCWEVQEQVLQLPWALSLWHEKVQLLSSSQEACSAHSLYHRRTEVPTGLICQGCQEAYQKARPKH